ncbi:transcriptional repressor [Cytophaga sp. FL35]|uniref:Fur family transcriptional regulator n=1 Tax=Cytophaga sp. FL35 TaxID=1904456 RepID=UPI00165395A7|nr:transcriptional repressor [Cytophaga sp. FL35]MBC6997010.1 transcriptional repressor [Cytophaga sp. FL35]
MGVIRNTKSVQLVTEFFNSTKEAIGVVDLVEKFSEQMNKSTIYRILDRLEDEGKVHAFLGVNGLKHYAKCKDCSHTEHVDVHPHFQCTTCGKVECVSYEISIPKLPNKNIAQAQLLLTGTCERCTS